MQIRYPTEKQYLCPMHREWMLCAAYLYKIEQCRWALLNVKVLNFKLKKIIKEIVKCNKLYFYHFLHLRLMADNWNKTAGRLPYA